MNAPKKTRQGPRKGIQASSFCLRLRMWIEIISKISILLFERYGERVFALNSEMILPQNTPKGTIKGLLLKWINTRDSNSYEYIRALYCASVGLFAGSGMVKIEKIR